MKRAPIPKQAAVWFVGLVAGVLGSLLMVQAEARADTTAPIVLISNVVDGETYVLGYDPPTATCATSDDVSGVASTATLTLTGGPLGVVNAWCSGASDGAGNISPAVTASYFVLSPSEGLEQAIQDFVGEEQRVAKALTKPVSRLAAAQTDEACLRIYTKFVHKVNQQIDRTLTEDEAAYLISLAGLL